LAQEGGGYLELRPVVTLETESLQERASHYLVGRVVHKALADWSCLAYLEPQLLDRLNEFARQAGAADDVASDAARKAQWMIGRVQRSSLYVEIDKAHSAQRFYSEVPFSLETEPVPLHGIVDLIYQHQAGLWHLIDWKTEWVDSDTSDNKAVFEHRHQIAAYAVAVERTLGVRPTVSLCFLNPGFRPIPISVEDVDTAWQEILEGAP
jgi:ATP-dependent exoDNAse (exonuclease V) beta subunit